MFARTNSGLCGAVALLVLAVGPAPVRAATLNSIDLTPANPAIDVGQSQAFTATGTFSDSTTQALEAVPTAIAASYYNTCTVLANGKVQCWGDNQYGQLGNGTTTQSASPVLVSGISTATAVATGYYSSCALLANGQVKCWGFNQYGQLGNGGTTQSNVPVTVSGISTATAIAMGYGHSCALLASGQVQCWGYNQYGQLGNGTTNSGANSAPAAVSGIDGTSVQAVAITAGYRHSCALLSSGAVLCWGYNQSGQLGNGSTSQSSIPVAVSGITSAVEVTAGYGHSCARLSSGQVQCWGNNTYGQLGNGSTSQSYVPVTVTGVTTAVELKAGYNHSCARLSGGQIQCWGANQYGQLGDATTTSSKIPVAVSGISAATALAAGYLHNCALLASGQEQCWGYNQDAQLGTSIQATTPVAVSGISAATGIGAGDSHSCAVISGGTVQCWGYNQNGQVGNGSATQQFTTPVAVSGISTATQVKGGGLHSCALLSNGAVQCWGYNQYGQLGNTTTTSSNNPVAVSGIDGSTAQATAIAAGYAHSCAVLSDSTVACWGDNTSGQLGNGTSTSSSTPVAVSGISSATALAAGYFHTCALLVDKTVKCWGYNGAGQLGNGTTTSSSTPVAVSGIDGTTVQAVALAAGYYHTCALLADGTVKCWGYNQYGQLGNGTVVSSSAPVAVTGISAATRIAAGGQRSCALLTSGQVQCWGDNSSGQLGNATTTQSTTPVTVSGISTATEIATGYVHSCALLAGGTEQCWGDNQYGQLGNGVSATSTTPQFISGAPKVVWSSSDTAVASIDASGLATALGTGSALITATTADGSVSGSTTLYVNSYSVGGSVTGLSGSVVLQNNGGDNLTVAGNGSFAFATRLATGATYNVSVATQPSGQTCTVSNAAGTIAGAAVTTVAVTCTTPPAPSTFTVGGTVTGLSGSLVLSNNGGDNLSLAANGSFTFATALADGATYSVAVVTQPSGQVCAVTNASGSISGANVASVTVSCTSSAPNNYTVGGTVTGLSGSLVLSNNGGDQLTVVTDGSFTFATALAGGAAYNVAVATQPSGQTCAVANGAGTVGSADVTNVSVSCTTPTTVAPLSSASGGGGGAASPLLLGGLVLALALRRSRPGRRLD